MDYCVKIDPAKVLDIVEHFSLHTDSETVSMKEEVEECLPPVECGTTTHAELTRSKFMSLFNE
jgi:hypothetical protein